MAPRRSTRIKAQSALKNNKSEEIPVKKKATTKKRAAAVKVKKGSLSNSVSKKRKTGLKCIVDTSTILGVVDPESNITGTIETVDNEPCDCMLVNIDPAQNTDKFFILQLIKTTNSSFIVYTRWGRTGSAGQGLEQKFDDYEEAVQTFESKFKEKVGLTWEKRDDPSIVGKYRVIKQNFVEKQRGYSTAKWKYWVDDGVDGKATGWYDYDAEGTKKVEQLYQENLMNPHLTNRFVESGSWTYLVDLSQMKQTNIKHYNKTSRHIRRFLEDMDDNESPIPLATPTSANSQPAPKPVTPSPTKSTDTIVPPATKSKSVAPPVDTDIDGYYPHTPSSNFEVIKNEDDQWYDVVLNQCNITGSSNNNKYYRLQMLKHVNGSLYVWFKWGRVGETSTGRELKGPYTSEEAACKVFAKKYQDKTKNKWGDDNFVPKKGKYTRIEIDNEAGGDSKAKKTNTNGDIEYLESKLDPKTRELIEELFSLETRDSALQSFNLDLKKLPLGVPSQQQIQNGVSILNKIKNKLNGGNVSDSYPLLSSQFYTAIPHSFGRSRPPAISTQTSLQERYDMCNILLDMFDTNETLQKIEAESTKQQVPYPADSHYDSLKADLSLVDRTSEEYKVVKTYFDETKRSSSSKLLDVWTVDRQGESKRHKKFDKIGNRSLLWHGTNIAVVAPIITSGLRIMPHSGGRVGAGIYLASMNQKSAGYTSAYGAKYACMFLCEGALGKIHTITQDDWSIKKPPKGFDSVHAVGTFTPKSWTDIKIEENSVKVPNTKGHSSGVSSSFYDDEFLVYDEAQLRLRYVVTVNL